MGNRESAKKIFLAGVKAVMPDKLIFDVIKLNGSVLVTGGSEFCLDNFRNIYVIGAGKASAAMAHYVENILGGRITGGHVVTKYGHSCKLRNIKVTEAGHPLPDNNSYKATGEILDLLRKTEENDLVICLISGGGSSLLADLPDGLLAEEIAIVNNLLIRCGASIDEINCVRKHLSLVKGGQLSRIVWPSTLITIILSDVIGNPPDVIASGPTVADPSTFARAIQVIEKYNLAGDLTNGVLNYLKEGAEGKHIETPKPGDRIFSRTYNILAGTNLTALEASAKEAENEGFRAIIVDDKVSSDVESVAQSIVETALRYKSGSETDKPVCLLYGGEPVIRVSGEGAGGRNQHLALSVALRLHGVKGITFLSAGTDGTDGPTSAAGAVVDSETITYATDKKVDAEKYLSEYDSFSFFRITGGQIITGPTFTNVMDIMLVLIEKDIS